MNIEPFEMERLQSQWENRVEYNLSESSVHPMALAELLDAGQLTELLQKRLGYTQTNGTVELRQSIAALYPGASVDHILVTNGAAEANFLAIWHLLDPGDEIVLMLPNYMQIWGLARSLSAKVVPFRLREECQWRPDLDELRRALSPRTSLIAVCNPNNPTGAVLAEGEMDAIVEAARRAGAWLLADEVYLGAERVGPPTPSFWGRYEKLVITNGLSKAYGLPGLRIGWVAGPPDLIARLWGCHDYTTIAVGALSDTLARVALASRERILGRTREILRANYPLLEEWLASQGDLFTLVPPAAGAIAYLHYSLEINSTRLMQKLLQDKSVLVVPGDHFGMDHYLRINYGPPADYLRAGLERVQDTMQELLR
ncbi:MAG: aminotransferase class I/II-fold pyridoxal phosphate-dependent enzyme [Acidobacteria bacterium]|nr:aminotransferase class I/II-fold pyridoxal phosphate-dependent enzyme [Acidobacteriota bacterium]